MKGARGKRWGCGCLALALMLAMAGCGQKEAAMPEILDEVSQMVTMDQETVGLLEKFYLDSAAAYEAYQDGGEVKPLIDGVYDSFMPFCDALQEETRRQVEGLPQEERMERAFTVIEWSAKAADILSVGLDYAEFQAYGELGQDYTKEEDYAEAMLQAADEQFAYFFGTTLTGAEVKN